MRRHLAVCFGILALGCGSGAASATPVSFSYPAVGVGTPFASGAGGTTAQFASNGDPYGFHVEPSTFYTITGPVLVESGISPDSGLILGISFGEAVVSMNFDFALDSTVTSTLDVAAFNGSSRVGEGSATGQVPSGGSVAEGVMTFSGAPFNQILIDDAVDPAFAIGEITISSIPEPAGWASIGLGLLTLAGLRRRRWSGIA